MPTVLADQSSRITWLWNHMHYTYLIMGALASQITSLTSVYSTVYSDADQRKHQSFVSLALVWGIHRGPVNSPHKWPITRKMFPFDDVIIDCLSFWDETQTDDDSRWFFLRHADTFQINKSAKLKLPMRLLMQWILYIIQPSTVVCFPYISQLYICLTCLQLERYRVVQLLSSNGERAQTNW